jgi:anti-sigma regulatory factor (Ser/Thr protein kinase)
MPQLRLAMDDSSRVGEARRRAVQLAIELGFNEVDTGRVAIVVTELATNLVRHARGGELLMQGEDGTFEVISVDAGPGGHEIDAWLRDGYSTGGTQGTGLGAVRRQSDEFDVFSQPGRGTALVARLRPRGNGLLAERPGPADLELGVVCLPVRTEVVCGDGWARSRSPGLSTLLVVDGLGHGPGAAQAADLARGIFARCAPEASPAAIMEALHAGLSGSRGAAAAVTQLQPAAGLLRFAGVGNISASLLSGTSNQSLMSHNGTLGVATRRIQELEYALPPSWNLLMHSDGLVGRYQLQDYPGLGARHVSLVAAILYRDFYRGRDDVTVLVARAGS